MDHSLGMLIFGYALLGLGVAVFYYVIGMGIDYVRELCGAKRKEPDYEKDLSCFFSSGSGETEQDPS